MRVEIRKLEQEHNHPGSMDMTGMKSVIDNKENSKRKEFKTMLQSLDSTVKVIEKKLNKQESQQQGYKQNKTGGYKGNYNNSKPHYQNGTHGGCACARSDASCFHREYFGLFNIFGLSYFTIYSSFHIFLL